MTSPKQPTTTAMPSSSTPVSNSDPDTRKRKRPGAASRVDSLAKESAFKRQRVREEEAIASASTRSTAEAVKHHYNAVPQRGRDWRRTESRIKGLRAFNNWTKGVIINKFSPDNGHALQVLDLGCGKGGDLAKWAQQPVQLYVGIDAAEVSITQAIERHAQMSGRGGQGGRGGYQGRRSQPVFHAEFIVQDAFSQSIGTLPIVRDVGFDAKGGRWGGGGFDMVSMMFCMHYAFEDEGKARGMLQNIGGALKKGGRFIGTIPNSDVLREKVEEFHKEQTTEDDACASWGNSIYRVRFPGRTPTDGTFRPPFGWKYNYFLEEAVEVPEYVVPWEAFRALAEDYNLELEYRKPFAEIWKEESDRPNLKALSERMGVIDRTTGKFQVTDEEMEAAGFYHAFCFYKV
ncbi:MAG: hypothetical protein Q9170_007842 [Blastenia crenularia]